jgi:hypothetical protein
MKTKMKSCRCHREGGGTSKRESKNIRWESEKMKKKRKSSMKMKSAALSSCPGECLWEQKMKK